MKFFPNGLIESWKLIIQPVITRTLQVVRSSSNSFLHITGSLSNHLNVIVCSLIGQCDPRCWKVSSHLPNGQAVVSWISGIPMEYERMRQVARWCSWHPNPHPETTSSTVRFYPSPQFSFTSIIAKKHLWVNKPYQLESHNIVCSCFHNCLDWRAAQFH